MPPPSADDRIAGEDSASEAFTGQSGGGGEDATADGRTVLRDACRTDVPAMVAIENAAFDGDRISARSFREFVDARSAELIVAEAGTALLGYALVLFRSGTAVARLYSLAVDPAARGQGIGRRLLGAVEERARERGALFLRLEVRIDNAVAAGLYRRAGYRAFRRLHDYYEDHADALRFEKPLLGHHSPAGRHVPYFAQTTDFTCGAAAMVMALAALDPAVQPSKQLELSLWREATTIFMTSGHGGCDPVGIAVALARRGLNASVWTSEPPPFFLDGVRTPAKREVMRIVQEGFVADAARLGVPLHPRALARDDIIAAIDGGMCAVVLISGWRMYHERAPHWVLVYGHDARAVFMHDPWIDPDEHDAAIAKAHLAVPWPEFDAMTAYGRTRLRAAVLVGPPAPRDGSHITVPE